MDDQTIILKLKQEGDAEIKRLSTAAAELHGELESLESSYASGQVKAATYRAEKQRLSSELAKTQRGLDQAKVAVQGYNQSIDASTAKIGNYVVVLDQAATRGAAFARQFGRGGNAGLALLEFSRLTEDAQYGVAGVLNNIPTLVMLLGGGGGVAGAISLVAVGANLLYKNWDRVETLWKGDTIETQTQRMERLAASTHKTADETKELTKWQAQQANLQKLLALPSDEQKKEGGAASTSLGKVGGSHAYEVTLKAAQEADERRTGIPTKNLPEEFQERQRIAASELLTEAMKGNERALTTLRDVLEKSTLRNDPFALSLGTNALKFPSAPGKDTAAETAFRDAEKQRVDREEADMLTKLGELYESETDVAEARRVVAEKEKQKAEAERAAKDAQAEQDQKGERGAKAYAPVFADALANRMARGAASGEDDKTLDESLSKQVEAKLNREGKVPQKQRAAMARQIVAQTRMQFEDFTNQGNAEALAANYANQVNPNAKLTHSQIFGRQPLSASGARRRRAIRGAGRLSAQSGGVAGPDGESISVREKSKFVAPEDMFKVKPGMFKGLDNEVPKTFDELEKNQDKSVGLLGEIKDGIKSIAESNQEMALKSNVAILG